MTITRRPIARSCRLALPLAVLTALAGCATTVQPTVKRTGQLPPPSTQPTEAAGAIEAGPQTPGRAATVLPGTGNLIDRSAASGPPPFAGEEGNASFNFEGQPLHAVVKAILGDLLQQNYTIAPGVQGNVTLSTNKPVNKNQALGLLEQALAANNARLIWADGRYNIVPSDQAVPGNLSPRTGSAVNARGYEVRAVPLRYISATEMEKLLKPYARPNGIVAVDPARNLITVAGTRAELENYLRTIEIFDVDWLAGMSVGIFPLEGAEAEKVAQDLDTVFGDKSNTPLAGMFRFLPLEGVNSVMVITPQPKYLGDVRTYIERMDAGGGEQARLYTYEVKYMKAEDLAEQLGNAFGASVSSTSRDSDGGSTSIMPGLDPVSARSISDPAPDAADPAAREAFEESSRRGGPDSGDGLAIGDSDDVSFSAVEESNTVLVRARPAQWESIRRAMERMDTMPMQVHIEAQVAEVTLTGNLEYGVSWFFSDARPDVASELEIDRLGDDAGSPVGLLWSISKAGRLAVIRALEDESDVRLLSTPSITVRNNVEAELKVGTNIPITSTSIGVIGGGTGGDNTVSNVQYLETGVILKVKPRVSSDGMVFMEISQEVSSPGATASGADNPPINTRNLLTEAAVQSGETVMLAGLVSDGETISSGGVPFLSRIPVLGSLFGTQGRRQDRQEIVIMITPTVIRDPRDARALTDEYNRRFRDIAPLRVFPASAPVPAQPAAQPQPLPPQR